MTMKTQKIRMLYRSLFISMKSHQQPQLQRTAPELEQSYDSRFSLHLLTGCLNAAADAATAVSAAVAVAAAYTLLR